jgi:O-antigen/teichoic acid export membrane protein
LLGAILKQTFPYALVILLMTLYTRIDMVMVGRLLPNGNQEADLYASAYRLLDAANMLGFLFATLLLPMFSRQLKRGEAIGELTSMGIQYIWAGAIPLAMSLIFFRTPIMEALYVNGSSYSGRILAWLMGSFLAVSGSYIYGTLLTAHGSLMAMNRIFLWGVLGNVGLNFCLIPRYQAEGAAMATCLTQFFVFVAQVFLSIRRVNLAPKPRLLARLALFLIICSGIAWWVSGYLSVSLLPGLLISLGCGGLAAITLRILDVKEAFHLLLNKNGGERGT